MSTQSEQLAPLQLISFDSNKNIVLNMHTAKIISQFVTPNIAVISVVGKYRTGKSFILNRVLLGTTKGFEVGPTINACTKGLWVWPKVVEIQTNEGMIPCLIMDTEGLGSIEEGENTDTKTFMLATLLSSYLIYNSMGSIDQKAIQSLGLIVNLSTMLQKAKQSDQEDIVACFPSFMWLVRDFFLKLQDQNGQKLTSKQYLENSLRAQKGRSDTIESKNKIRSQLREYFKERECCTLVRPTNYDSDLRFLNTLPESKLRPEFCQQIQQLKSKLSRSLKPKSFQGKPCSPQAFIQMCQGFVEAMNAGGVPSISSNWLSVCNSESQRIINEVQIRHQSQINRLVLEGLSLAEIETSHKQMVQEGYAKIDSTFLGVVEKQQKKKKLKKRLKQVFLNVRQERGCQQFDSLRCLIEEAFLEVLREIRVNKFDSFEEVMEKFQMMSVDPSSNQPQMVKELYLKLKNISVEYIHCLEEKWRTQNLLLKQKEEWMEKDYSDKKLELQSQLEAMYDRQRKDEMEKYRLRCTLDDRNERIQLLEEEIADGNLEKVRLKESNLGSQTNHEALMEQISERLSSKTQELAIVSKCKAIEYQELQASTNLQICSLRTQLHKLNFSEKTIDELRCRVSALEEEKQTLQDTLRFENKDSREEPLSDKQLNLRLRILQKQKQCLLRELHNQKSINQGLIKTFQSNPSFVLVHQIDTLQKQNAELKQLIKSLKQYEKVLLSCDLLKCRLCDHSYSFGEFKTHLLLCKIPIEFDISYQIDGWTQKVVFVVEVNRGTHSWSLRKKLPNIRCFLKLLKLPEAAQFTKEEDSSHECERRRVLLDQILNKIVKEHITSSVTMEFLGLDIHSRRRDILNMSSIEDNSLRQTTNKTSATQEGCWQNTPQHTQERRKQSFLSTCRFSSTKGFLLPH